MDFAKVNGYTANVSIRTQERLDLLKIPIM